MNLVIDSLRVVVYRQHSILHFDGSWRSRPASLRWSDGPCSLAPLPFDIFLVRLEVIQVS
jgi:hypothetical protein